MRFISSLLACLLIACLSVIARADELEENFRSPPDSARPHTWWHWMNGNVSRDGITKDLEAMKRIGLGGFQAFHVTDAIPPGPVGYMSDQWLDLMEHTVAEADRLGLEMCMHNCAGWSSSGGPWISAEQSMQEIVWTETQVEGGKVEAKLKQPTARRDFYRDIAVIAFPTAKGNFRLREWEWKIDRNTTGRKPDSQITPDARTAPADQVVPLASVVDVTDKMESDGSLRATMPPGEWTIVRFGHTTTGRTNKPAPPEGLGLECNKLDRQAVKHHWDHSVARVLDRAGPRAGKAFNSVLIDSWEVGFQNWTPGLNKIFQERVGYDMTKYLPCFTGRVVESVDTSEKFLWDFRRLIADLMAENYFGYFKSLARERGLKLSIEPHGPSGFDYFQVAAIADIPMGEFWVDRADAWHTWTTKIAASAAHATGRKFVGAESFTARPPASAYTDHPFALKPLGDEYFAQGLNRIIFHTNVHQPWGDDVLPGMTMGPHGIQFNRNNTWHRFGRPFIDTLSRTQYLLQQGTAVADLCYLAAEDAPQTPLNRDKLNPPPPNGCDYDMLHSNFIMQMTVKDGRLMLPSGMSYRALVLPDTERMRPALLKKVRDLRDAGATVVAPRKIIGSPSLRDDDREVQKLSEGLSADMPKLPRDFETEAELAYMHRQVNGADVYFVANTRSSEIAPSATFRAIGEPEIWRTDDGRIERATDSDRLDDARTRVPLKLGPAESAFIVFRAKSHAPQSADFKPAGEMPIEGPWQVKCGAKSIELPKLISWPDHADADIKYFSGTAIYSTTFTVPPDRKRARLDLGDVQILASVKLNGRDLGILWKPPFRLDISRTMHPGENQLEIAVTNLWVNRLIGDEKFPSLAEYAPTKSGGQGITSIPKWLLDSSQPRPETKRQTFATWRHYQASDALRPSGLIGPVRIEWSTD